MDYLNFCSAVPSYSYGAAAAAAVSTLFPGAECKSLAANLGESIRHPPVTCFNNYLRFHALKCEHKSAFRKIFDKIQPDILYCLHPAYLAAAALNTTLTRANQGPLSNIGTTTPSWGSPLTWLWGEKPDHVIGFVHVVICTQYTLMWQHDQVFKLNRELMTARPAAQNKQQPSQAWPVCH